MNKKISLVMLIFLGIFLIGFVNAAICTCDEGTNHGALCTSSDDCGGGVCIDANDNICTVNVDPIIDPEIDYCWGNYDCDDIDDNWYCPIIGYEGVGCKIRPIDGSGACYENDDCPGGYYCIGENMYCELIPEDENICYKDIDCLCLHGICLLDVEDNPVIPYYDYCQRGVCVYPECDPWIDCPIDYWTGTLTCTTGDVWQDYVSYSCIDNNCVDSTNSLKKIECGTNICTDGECIAAPVLPTCDDGFKNQNELCVDQGGECSTCDNDGTCDSACGETSVNCANDCYVPINFEDVSVTWIPTTDTIYESEFPTTVSFKIEDINNGDRETIYIQIWEYDLAEALGDGGQEIKTIQYEVRDTSIEGSFELTSADWITGGSEGESKYFLKLESNDKNVKESIMGDRFILNVEDDCGNGVCQDDIGEDYDTCSDDCPAPGEPNAYWADILGVPITSFTYSDDTKIVKLRIDNYPGSSVVFHLYERDTIGTGDGDLAGIDEDLGTITGTVSEGVAIGNWTMDDADFKEEAGDTRYEDNFEFYFKVDGVTFEEKDLNTFYAFGEYCTSENDCTADAYIIGTATCSTGGDVIQDYSDWSCTNYDCVQNIIEDKVRYDCGTLGCEGGVCNSNIPCSSLTPQVCSSYNVYGSATICGDDYCGFAIKENECNPLIETCTCEWTVGDVCELDTNLKPYCGDGSCDLSIGENVLTCDTDCTGPSCEDEGYDCAYSFQCNAQEGDSSDYNNSCGGTQICCSQVIPTTETDCYANGGGTCTYESNCLTPLEGYDCNIGLPFCCDVLVGEGDDEPGCEVDNSCENGDICALDSDCISGDCTEGICVFNPSENSYGSCSYEDQTSEDDTCDDGYISYSWNGTWSWEDNKYISEEICESGGTDCIEDPEFSGEWHMYSNSIAEAFTECTLGEETLPCPAQVQLPFFSWLNLVIAIVLIGLVYYFFDVRKKPVKKKVVKRKKRK